MKVKIWMGLLTMGLFFGVGQWAANGESELFESEGRSSRVGVAPVNNEMYAQECGACHFSYQPGLLPAKSWDLMMSNLSDHFGDNAALDAKDQKTITDYLVKNAADRSKHKRSTRIMRTLKGKEVPLRISELPYIIRQHHEIPLRLIEGNSEVGSLSNCTACHMKAEEGIYEENTVRIPGVGKWED